MVKTRRKLFIDMYRSLLLLMLLKESNSAFARSPTPFNIRPAAKVKAESAMTLFISIILTASRRRWGAPT